MTFKRGGDEFTRALTFSDGVFAIAITLLIVGVDVPSLENPTDSSELWDRLGDIGDSFTSFFISFAVIARFWIAHHRFVAQLSAIDGGFLALNLAYLAMIAFLPYPTNLFGDYFDNPLAVSLYALNVAVVSALEVAMMRHAHRHKLFIRRVPPEIYRWWTLMSLMPVFFFLVSIPVAFLISSPVAVVLWFAGIPIGALASRYAPEDADKFRLG